MLQVAAVTPAKQSHCQEPHSATKISILYLSAVCSLAYYNYIKRQASSFHSPKMILPG